jgi:hypothetical protein
MAQDCTQWRILVNMIMKLWVTQNYMRMDLREIWWGGGCLLDTLGTGEGPVAGCYEHGNEPSVSIKGGEFVD